MAGRSYCGKDPSARTWGGGSRPRIRRRGTTLPTECGSRRREPPPLNDNQTTRTATWQPLQSSSTQLLLVMLLQTIVSITFPDEGLGWPVASSIPLWLGERWVACAQSVTKESGNVAARLAVVGVRLARPVRPISLLRLSLLRFADSEIPGDSLWTRQFHHLNLRFCFSQTL